MLEIFLLFEMQMNWHRMILS